MDHAGIHALADADDEGVLGSMSSVSGYGSGEGDDDSGGGGGGVSPSRRHGGSGDISDSDDENEGMGRFVVGSTTRASVRRKTTVKVNERTNGKSERTHGRTDARIVPKRSHAARHEPHHRTPHAIFRYQYQYHTTMELSYIATL